MCTVRSTALPEGEPLLEWCERYQLEGIVWKRRNSGYASGTSRNWVKVKCYGWSVANQHRHKLFKAPDKTEQSHASANPKES